MFSLRVSVLRDVVRTQRGNAQTGNFDALIQKKAVADKLRMKTEREAPCLLSLLEVVKVSADMASLCFLLP